jgi:hypothetical protein
MTSTYSSSLGGAVRSDYIPFKNQTIYMSPGNANLVGSPIDTRRRATDRRGVEDDAVFPLPNVAVGTGL